MNESIKAWYLYSAIVMVIIIIVALGVLDSQMVDDDNAGQEYEDDYRRHSCYAIREDGSCVIHYSTLEDEYCTDMQAYVILDNGTLVLPCP